MRSEAVKIKMGSPEVNWQAMSPRRSTRGPRSSASSSQLGKAVAFIPEDYINGRQLSLSSTNDGFCCALPSGPDVVCLVRRLQRVSHTAKATAHDDDDDHTSIGEALSVSI